MASAAGARAGHRSGVDIEKHLYGMLFAGLLAARIAFALQYADQYLASPWRMLDVRDGCPPCRREMPVLQQAQAQRGDVHFVFLNQGETPSRVQAFLATQPQALRNVLLDTEGRLGVQRGHRALPTTLFFDAQGRLVDTRVGELSAASLAERLSRLDAEPGRPAWPAAGQRPPAALFFRAAAFTSSCFSRMPAGHFDLIHDSTATISASVSTPSYAGMADW